MITVFCNFLCVVVEIWSWRLFVAWIITMGGPDLTFTTLIFIASASCLVFVTQIGVETM